MALVRCPVCRKRFDSELDSGLDGGQPRSLPFCSPRCRQIDLGRWLDEQYSVPVEREDEERDYAEDGPAPPETD